MPAIKTAARKGAKAQGRRTARKVTLDDVWAGFASTRVWQSKDKG